MPRSNQAMQRPDLGSVAYEYMVGAADRGFIGTRVLPFFNTPIQSAEYPVIPTEALLKQKDTARAARANYARDDWGFDFQNYSTKEYGWEEQIEDSEVKLYQRYFDLELVATERATDVLLSGFEQRVANLTQAAASAGSTTAATAAWSNPATATPRADVDAARAVQRAAGGIVGDTLVMGWTAFQNLLVTNEVKTYLQYTSPHLVDGIEAQKSTMARYLGVRQILVGDAIKDTAKKGKATVIGDIWDNTKVNLIKLSTGGQNLREPAFGRTFLWTQDSPNEITTETYREEQTRSNIIRVRHHVDEAIQMVNANHLITGV